MLGLRNFHATACASCRLRATITAKQAARSRFQALSHCPQTSRLFGTSLPKQLPRDRFGKRAVNSMEQEMEEIERVREMMRKESGADTEQQAQAQALLDSLPEPDKFETRPLTTEDIVKFARESFGDELPDGVLNEEQYKAYERLYGKPLPAVEEGELVQELEDGSESGTGILRELEDGELEEVEFEDGEGIGKKHGNASENVKRKSSQNYDDLRLAQDIEFSHRQEVDLAENTGEEEQSGPRTHPLTVENRFGPSPSTVFLPKDTFEDPVTLLLSGMPSVHLKEAAHRTFGGVGLPYSPSTPELGRTKQAKPIALDATQSGMTQIEGDVYMAAVMPAVFACITGVLAETRKRLGTKWAEEMVRKAVAGELRILDAGGAGAGVIAVREVLRAEWERMSEDNSTAVAPADGKVGGPAASPPLGTATVLAGSSVLRKRASQLLENTTFIPRLPDYIHAQNAPASGKFDIIIAPHTLWPLREDYMRKKHVQNLWSMLSTDGGILLVLEKGVPRGFELVAGAREMLLDNHIASPGAEETHIGIEEPEIEWENGEGEIENESTPSPETPKRSSRAKDTGMIIAPCTNHSPCPMYQPKGMVKGRRSLCQFEQRYIRPPFLQKILGAKDKNFEDVAFSYFSAMRGRDLRSERNITQNAETNNRAFAGFEHTVADGQEAPNSLALPRLILPPLKRRGHVVLDVCTSAGTLERWTVPRSFSKQAFRDARKASWGDLWALGAKTRVAREALLSKHSQKGDLDIKLVKSRATRAPIVDDEGRLVFGGAAKKPEKTPRGDRGQMRTGKVKGIRDKRDKKATGNGRRKNRDDE